MIPWCLILPLARWKVSIHTLHELEARKRKKSLFTRNKTPVSIHTLHELEARWYSFWSIGAKLGFHSYASRIGSKLLRSLNIRIFLRVRLMFPFIRFTNWKQGLSLWVCTGERWRFHSYASRIGSKFTARKGLLSGFTKLVVSIHTLHELEAR